MAGQKAGAVLLAEILPGQADDVDGAIFDGWGPPETAHRWTVGHESRVRLPPVDPEADAVLVLDMKPYCDAECPHQTVMLALDERLLATVQLADQRVMGFRLPARPAGHAGHIISFTHLNSRLPRAPTGVDHGGRPLGLMVISLRLYGLREAAGAPAALPACVGLMPSGDLQRTARQRTGMSVPALAGRFECLGHNCEIGTVQRELGAEPLGLLRFAAGVTHRLADGLRYGFSGIGAPGAALITIKDDPQPQFIAHEQRYYLTYATARSPDETTAEKIRAEHCRKLIFLQRKFIEDLQLGEKIFTVSRIEPMREAEALAIFCALNLHGRNTLLWTIPGDPALAGSVDQVRPRFLRGHLGAPDPAVPNASLEAWLSVMVNAHDFKKNAVSSGRS